MSIILSFKDWASSGFAMALSSLSLNFTDVIKVRMQINSKINTSNSNLYFGFRQTLTKIFIEEGFFGLWTPGIIATCLRELSYGGLTFALYPILKKKYGIDSKDDTNVLAKLLSGFCSGLCASGLATPTDLIKIRLQQNSGKIINNLHVSGMFKGKKPYYFNTSDAFVKIYQKYGFIGLFKGTSPTMLRASLLIAGKFASYDQTKTLFRNKGYSESIKLHLIGGLTSGFVASIFSAPADIMKTRLMCDPERKIYNGLFDCFIKICRNEGSHVLVRGFWPSFARQGPHFVISTLLMEQCRCLIGLDYF